jgi:hypothetical protein
MQQASRTQPQQLLLVGLAARVCVAVQGGHRPATLLPLLQALQQSDGLLLPLPPPVLLLVTEHEIV